MAVFPLAKKLNEEKCRHQCQFPVEKRVEKIQRRERPTQPGELQAQQREVRARPVGVFPGRQHHQRCQQRGEQQHERIRAIQADKIINVQRRNPRCLLNKLQALAHLKTQQQANC